jgi:hypothetical protein
MKTNFEKKISNLDKRINFSINKGWKTDDMMTA